MTIKKFIDLKFKTKYTSQKKEEAQQQKLSVKPKTKLSSIN